MTDPALLGGVLPSNPAEHEAFEQQLARDVELYGNAYEERDEHGGRRRINPTAILIYGPVLPSNPADPLIEISGADALDEFLMDANDAGETPTFAAIDGNGVAFLASLQEVGGDCTQVVYIGTDEDGGPGGRANCDECGDHVSDWTPKFPINLVVLR